MVKKKEQLGHEQLAQEQMPQLGLNEECTYGTDRSLDCGYGTSRVTKMKME